MNVRTVMHILTFFLLITLALTGRHVIAQVQKTTPALGQTGVSTTTPPPASAPANPPALAQKSWFEIAALFAWPAVAFFVLLIFRVQLKDFLAALSRHMQKARVKMLGVEFEIAHIQNTEQFKEYSMNIGEKSKISGDPDQFQLLCKASNSRQSKSTKIMNFYNGCLVQVSTREVMGENSIAIAEALAFVPGLNIKIQKKYEVREPESYEKVLAEFLKVGNNAS